MPLPLTTVALVAAVIFAFAFGSVWTAGVLLILAAINEGIRALILLGPTQAAPVAQRGDITLIPNRERTPIGGPDGEEE